MKKLLCAGKDWCTGARLLEQAGRIVVSLAGLVCVFSIFSRDYSWQSPTHRPFSARLSSIRRHTGSIPSIAAVYDEHDPEDRMGKPVFGKDFIIFYNAIPKTGSRSLDSSVIQNNKAKPHHLLTFKLIPAAAFEDSKLLNEFVASRVIPSFIRGHAMYDEFKNGPKIVYINAVRDPVDRVISNYYFDLFGDGASSAVHAEDNWPTTIDECIQTPANLCNDAIEYYQAVTLRQFCGMEERCKTVSRWTLEKAKLNARKYIVIGLTSDMENTLKALGLLIPDLFGGIYNKYTKYQNISKTHTKTSRKPKPQPETIRILRRRMHLQYEFYEFISARFQRLKHILHIS